MLLREQTRLLADFFESVGVFGGESPQHILDGEHRRIDDWNLVGRHSVPLLHHRVLDKLHRPSNAPRSGKIAMPRMVTLTRFPVSPFAPARNRRPGGRYVS